MILVCDIGNTNITLGLYKDSSLILREKIATTSHNKFKEFLKNAFRSVNIAYNKIRAAVICSVVPKAALSIKNALLDMTDASVYVVGENINVPIKNLYSKPKQVGSDRLIASFSAMRIYGAPVIVVDFGTAITIDVVSKNKEYLGGIIAPGINLSLSALSYNTALLPKLKLSHPRKLIGKSAKASMLSGATFGVASLVDGLILKLKNELKDNTIKVVATGGDSQFIKRYCKEIDYVEPDLILRGMVELLSRFV